MEELMKKLAISKKIMDKHNEIPRNSLESNINVSSPQVESFQPVEGAYNIPENLLSENNISEKIESPTQHKILGSKLPDEIKRLMIEHPIEPPSTPFNTSNVLSEEVIKGAQKLMGNTPKTNVEQKKQPQNNVDFNSLKNMIRDTVRDTVRDVVREELEKAGMITESENKTNEILQLKVGKHIFEGKVTKIKKVQ